MTKPLFPISGSRATPAPAELGRPLDAQQIREQFFHNRVSREWILANVAPTKKWNMGKVAVWFEADVKAWMSDWVKQQQQRAQRRRGKPLDD